MVDLLTYWPNIMGETKEMQYIATAENPELSELWGGVQDVFSDQFVESLTEYGAKRWESMLGIIPKGTDSLEDRRFRILTRLNERLPYTYPMLCQQLAILCGEEGYQIELKPEEYTLLVRVAYTTRPKYEEVRNLLERIVPINLVQDYAGVSEGIIKLFGKVETVPNVKVRFSPHPVGDALVFDGNWFFDNTYCFNGIRRGKELEFYPVVSRIKTWLHPTPRITVVGVVEKDWWTFDGSVVLNGTRLLDAEKYYLEG